MPPYYLTKKVTLMSFLFSFRTTAFVVAVLGVAAVATSALPALADDSASALSDMSAKVQFFTLKNGLRVVMYNRGTAPVFSGAVVVRVGGSDELPGQTGISHMFEHMAFKGTKTVGTTDFAQERKLLDRVEEISAASSSGNALSPDQKKEWEALHTQLKKVWQNDDFTARYDRQGAQGQNATTDKEFTKYFVNLPRSAFEFWCRMEADRLINPVMRQFYQERDVVQEERRMRYEDDPAGKLYELLLGVAYQRHPYRAPVIGYDRDIQGLTAARLDEFRRRFYVPSNMVVSIVGRVDPTEDIKVVEQYFGELPAAPTPSREYIINESPQEGERRVTLSTTAAPQVMIAYNKKSYPHPDDPALSLMTEILSGGKVSPLYTELVKKRQLISGISSDEGPGVAYPNLVMFIAPVKSPHSTDEVIDAFDAVVAKFKRTGATQEQLDIAKRSIGMQYLDHLRSNQSLALDFASSELVYGSWRASVEWYDKVMNTSLAEVKRVTEQYLVDNQRTIGTIERAK